MPCNFDSLREFCESLLQEKLENNGYASFIEPSLYRVSQ